MSKLTFETIVDTNNDALFDVVTRATAPKGALPVTPDMLINRSSGDLFGWGQDAGMGWDPQKLGGKEILILSTHGGIRSPDGKPVALGYHTGNWEVGLLVEAAAKELKSLDAIPFAGFCTDPCDGRTQGNPGMYDSLAYRNDASIIFRRLIRSLPTLSGVIGAATCDKGLPAMMMALAAIGDKPSVLIPGGSTLLPSDGEDAGTAQSLGARYAHGKVTLDYVARNSCGICGSPGGGCQFLGTASTSQVVGEALGMSLIHSALAPSGQGVWLDMARRSARAVLALEQRGLTMQDILSQASVHNAMVTYAAFGGSTNLIMHLTAIAHAAGLQRPTIDDWTRINQQTPRLVDVLPNGPVGHATVQVFLAGGVPEVMLHLRDKGLLDLDAMTVAGEPLGRMLDWWEASERRVKFRQRLTDIDGINPNDVIMDPDTARKRGSLQPSVSRGETLLPTDRLLKALPSILRWWMPMGYIVK